MIIRSMNAPVVVIEGSFYTVDRSSFADAREDEVELHHVPLGRQPQRSPHCIAWSVLKALFASGDAVLIDGLLLEGACRSIRSSARADRPSAAPAATPALADSPIEGRADSAPAEAEAEAETEQHEFA